LKSETTFNAHPEAESALESAQKPGLTSTDFFFLRRADVARLEPSATPQLESETSTDAIPVAKSALELAHLRLVVAAQRAAAAAKLEPAGQLPTSAPAYAELLQAALVAVASAQSDHGTPLHHGNPLHVTPLHGTPLAGLAASLPFLQPMHPSVFPPYPQQHYAPQVYPPAAIPQGWPGWPGGQIPQAHFAPQGYPPAAIPQESGGQIPQAHFAPAWMQPQLEADLESRLPSTSRTVDHDYGTG